MANALVKQAALHTLCCLGCVHIAVCLAIGVLDGSISILPLTSTLALLSAT